MRISEVTTEEGKAMARELGADIFAETSARCGENVDAMFEEV